MNNELVSSKVYRFHDHAAIHVKGYNEQGTTVYLSAKEARKIASALFKVARSIESESYADNKVGSIEIK